MYSDKIVFSSVSLSLKMVLLMSLLLQLLIITRAYKMVDYSAVLKHPFGYGNYFELSDEVYKDTVKTFEKTEPWSSRKFGSMLPPQPPEIDGETVESQSSFKSRLGDMQQLKYGKFNHHNFTETTAYLKHLAGEYGHIARLSSIGKSGQGRDLWVLVISDYPDQHEIGEPEFRYIGNMHGNEVVSLECMLWLAEWLCVNYGVNPWVTKLVDTTRINILATMNPDGREISVEGDVSGYVGRLNSQKVDLNRNFPESQPSSNPTPQPETLAVMQWHKEHPFVLSANLHGGSLLVNYPYDQPKGPYQSEVDFVYSKAPDDLLLKKLSMVYSKAHTTMWRGLPCEEYLPEEFFPYGITNGAAWYIISGGMQDWVYESTSCIDLTIEMGCYKYPYARNLRRFWDENKFALLAFIDQIHTGVTGMVRDYYTYRAIPDTVIYVQGNQRYVHAAADGDFWRLLNSGVYNITATAPGYQASTVTVTVQSMPPATTVDIFLKKL